MHDNWVQLIGTYSVLNRGVVVHARSDDEGRGDDEGSIATGNAGHRLACGAILCRSCLGRRERGDPAQVASWLFISFFLETLRAEAPVQSDDGSASGLYAFQQTINQVRFSYSQQTKIKGFLEGHSHGGERRLENDDSWLGGIHSFACRVFVLRRLLEWYTRTQPTFFCAGLELIFFPSR